jgi:hypothetical protein
MVQYSVKKSRGRKIKKYRKSRRGEGRGKRSLKGGKTRRHTLGKRKGKGRGRQMMGGVYDDDDWNVDSDTDIGLIKDYINAKYKDNFESCKIPKKGFSMLKVIVCGEVVGADGRGEPIILTKPAVVMITNLSKSFFKEKNQRQNVLMFECYVDNDVKCYALVRCPMDLHKNDGSVPPSTNVPPIIGMNPKILFISPNKSNVELLDFDNLDNATIVTEACDRYKKNGIETCKKIRKDTIDYYKTQNNKQKIIEENDAFKEKVKRWNSLVVVLENFKRIFKCYEFTSFISSDGDRYRIFSRWEQHNALFEKIIMQQAHPEQQVEGDEKKQQQDEDEEA